MALDINSNDHYPHWPLAFAVCGWSGSGKTWLLERLIPRLSQQGLRLGAVKHDAHRLHLDRPGKNTTRLWEAGAHALLAHDSTQGFFRYHKSGHESLTSLLNYLAGFVDLVLVEGHKTTGLPKIWLQHPTHEIPENLGNVVLTLDWDDPKRLEKSEAAILQWLREQWRAKAVYGAVLFGGQSRRMGQAKHTLRLNHLTVLEHLTGVLSAQTAGTVFLGDHNLLPNDVASRSPTVLPDAPGGTGPMAGLLSAMRWHPARTWLLLACDMPLMTPEALHWLLEQRAPGYWCILPTAQGQRHPLGAVYEPPMHHILEVKQSIGELSLKTVTEHPKTKTVEIPQKYQPAWTNCNTPDDWEKIQHQFNASLS